MMTKLTFVFPSAHGAFGAAHRRWTAEDHEGATSEEPRAAFLDWERLAAMPLPALLYYALTGEEVADELA